MFQFARSNTHAHHNTRFEKQADRDADLHETQMPQKAQVM